jgi:galactonate dehydratase
MRITKIEDLHCNAGWRDFSFMKVSTDEVPWNDDLVTPVPKIEHGMFILPTGPGWGVEVNEEVIRTHPPQPMGRWER